jgi:type VI protein secretion system component Hcp
MDNAQLYLSLVRPSMIPVVGEAADDLFIKQIEVTGWKWGFHNAKEQKEAQKRREAAGRSAEFLGKSDKTRSMEASIKRFEAERKRALAREAFDKEEALSRNDPKAMEKWIKAYDTLNEKLKDIDKALDEGIADLYRDADAAEEAEKARRRREDAAAADRDERHQAELDRRNFELELENQKFQFSFSKRIDLATTQMLNSMKAGDVFPLAVFTMHQYSSNNPMSLVIKIEGLRLLKYGFVVDAGDTMTDLKEEWSCDFKMFSYVYQNRRSVAKPSVGSVSDAKQVAAKAATQGTVRTFIMLPKKF